LAIKAGQEVAPGQPNKLESWLNVLATRSKPLKPKDAKKGTDRRLEDVVRLSAEECERISNQLGETDALSLKYFTIPDFLYFPAHLFDKQGPKQWARMRIMQACERLNVPAHRCPKFADLDLPRRYGMNYLVKESLSIQSFHPLYESEAEWRDRARRDLENLLDQNASQFRLWFKREIEAGNVKKIPRTRDTTPLDLRYEWAARWYCLGESYKAISTDEYKVDRVRKTIKAILRQAGLPGRK
jgi:hypothetical protein